MEALDKAIIAEYPKFDTPADQIVTDPELAAKFQCAVNAKLPPGSTVNPPVLNKRLLNLRRKGEGNGGLPRLRRGYDGRGPNKPR